MIAMTLPNPPPPRLPLQRRRHRRPRGHPVLGRHRARRPLAHPLSAGRDRRLRLLRPDLRPVLARHRLSRPRHPLAHPRGRPLHRRHLARRRRHRLRLGRGARHDRGGDRRLARHRAQPLARRAELDPLEALRPRRRRRPRLLHPGADRHARGHLHPRRLPLRPRARGQRQHHGLHHRRPRPRRAHALPDRPELLPNILGPVLADLGLRFVFIVLLLSGLSFLGLGVQPPNADWGSLVRENIGGLPFGAPAVIVPSLAIASLTISVNLLIDNLPHQDPRPERLMPNLVEIRDLRVEAKHRLRPYGRDHQGRQPRRRRRRDRRPDRRKRLRQDHHRADPHGPHPPRLPHRRRLGPRRRARHGRASPSPSAPSSAAPRSPTCRRAPPPPSTRPSVSSTR